jgi:hypothetical protein
MITIVIKECSDFKITDVLAEVLAPSLEKEIQVWTFEILESPRFIVCIQCRHLEEAVIGANVSFTYI